MAHASLVQAVTDYLDRVAEIHATGVAREHAYRPLHLLESADTRRVSDLTTTFPVSGSNAVTERRHSDERLWINDTQYLGNVPKRTWDYTVGGYQVLDKWLKDRKGRRLSQDELVHLQRVATAIGKVIEMQDGLATE